MRVACAFILASALFISACQKASEPPALTQEDLLAIEATTEAFATAIRNADWAALAATYTADAVLLPPNAPALEGRDAIRAFFALFPPVASLEMHNVEVRGFGEYAFVRGDYAMTLKAEGMDPVTDTGSYLEIRRKQPDGSWLIHRDMFHSNQTAHD